LQPVIIRESGVFDETKPLCPLFLTGNNFYSSVTRSGQWKMPRRQHRTANRRRAGAVATARWKRGLYAAEALAEQKRVRELLAQSRELLKQMQAG
jgi:hypothetical protein